MFRVQGLGIKGRTEDAVKMRVEEASICVLARVESAILASTYLYKSTMDSELVGLTGPLWDGYHESRRCSRKAYPASYITKYTSIRRQKPPARQPRQFQSQHVFIWGRTVDAVRTRVDEASIHDPDWKVDAPKAPPTPVCGLKS